MAVCVKCRQKECIVSMSQGFTCHSLRWPLQLGISPMRTDCSFIILWPYFCFHSNNQCVILDNVWSQRTIFSSCSQMGCHQRSLTGWRPPSPGGFDGLWDVQMRSPSFAALCMQCRLAYLWRGMLVQTFHLDLCHQFKGISGCFANSTTPTGNQ